MNISASLRQKIIAAANYRCEYCRTSSQLTGIPLVMDHILPKSLGGSDKPENLAASCYRCNEFKGAKTHAKDPATSQFITLFNPRYQTWHSEFVWGNGGTHIIGKTAIGRTTVIALRLNNDQIVEARALWISARWHPPSDHIARNS
ncbi:MAG: HNH endonuclease [Cyanobacteria bacterium J06597_16]